MYIPRANEENRAQVLHQLIRNEPLAALVTMTSAGLFASHIPMVLQESASGFGVLRGHISRANTQWRDLDPAVDALAIFAGPQHYITPTWYPAKAKDGKVVPTWNYIVVHAYGPLEVVQDEAWLLDHLHALTAQFESSSPSPWRVDDAPADYIQTLIKGIVGFELPIRKLEGKWKLSQNRSIEDRQGVMAGLSALNTPESLEMKRLIPE